jgi:hypothetical protein
MRKLNSFFAFSIVFIHFFINFPQIAKSDDVDTIPLQAFPELALDYLHTWRYRSISQIAHITITATEFHYRTTFMDGYEYKLTNLIWTEIIRPDDAFQPFIGFEVDNYKGAVGYSITGTINFIYGDWRNWRNKKTLTQYIFLNPNDNSKMLWYNEGQSNIELYMIE